MRTPRAAASVALAASAVALSLDAGGASGATPHSKDALVELGRRLFFERTISPFGMRSCADCHDPANGFADAAKRSLALQGTTLHHSQTLVDVADSPNFHWHGEVSTIAEVVEARVEGTFDATYYGVPAWEEDPPTADGAPATPGEVPPPLRGFVPFHAPETAFVSNLSGPTFGRAPDGDAVKALEHAGRYHELFTAAFGNRMATVSRVAEAIEAYCRTIRSGPSPYDRFVAGDGSALSAQAKRGLERFRGSAGCAECHSLKGSRAPFTDYRLHETAAGIPFVRGPRGGAAPPGIPGVPPVVGSGALLRGVEEATLRQRSFKTPTLRDVARRGPFLHDGSAPTLEDAVRRFMPGAAGAKELSPADAEAVADVAEFLRALTSAARPGLAAHATGARAKTTHLRIVDAAEQRLVGFPVTLVPAGDPLPGAERPSPLTLVTDADGRVTFEPFLFTHARIVLDGGLLPEGGALVPDTCHEAELRLPIRGHARVALTVESGHEPAELVARHPNATLFPERAVPATVLRLASVSSAGTAREAVYEGWMRTDVPAEAVLALPDPLGRRDVTLVPNAVVRIGAPRRK